MPRVSIIVPNYNHADYLQQRMDSVLNQSYQDFEVILLDDCSIDGSKKIIEKYRKHPKVNQIIYNEVNSGTAYRQWSKGIQYALGELIWIAESDDWCHYKFLETLVHYFDDKDIVVAFTHSKLMYDGDPEPDERTILQPEISDGIEFVRDVMLTRNYILNASMVIFRKDAYFNIEDKRWKEMKLAGDWMLWIQLLKEGKKVEVFNELNYCRRHSSNTTSKFRKLGYDFIEGIEVLKKGREICNNKYSRKSVFLTWVSLYKTCKDNFDPGVNKRVLSILIRNEPMFYFYFLYGALRKYIRLFLYQLKQAN